MSIALTLHLLSAIIWVGGMFFSYVILRPVAGQLLEPPVRLTLWSNVFKGFFPWVWVAILVLFVSGYWMVFNAFGGFKGAGTHIHIMHGLALLMTAIYLHLFFAPRKRLNRFVADQDWPAAGKQLAQIRVLVGINMVIGFVVAAVGSGGRYLF